MEEVKALSSLGDFVELEMGRQHNHSHILAAQGNRISAFSEGISEGAANAVKWRVGNLPGNRSSSNPGNAPQGPPPPPQGQYVPPLFMHFGDQNKKGGGN